MVSRRAVFALFFLSGIAGLIYQVLWLRRLSLVFGVTVYAASTVLAAFMAGLAIGSLLAGRVLRRRVAPLQAFGVVEILVGVTGLASPLLLEAASSIYLALHRAAPDSLELLTVARLVCSFAILVVPTGMMGMTLPLLSAAVAPTSGSIGSSISLLYAVNTAGAMVGALATGFVLIPAIGIERAFFVAAALNVVVGGISVWMSRGHAADTHPDEPASDASTGDTRDRRALLTWPWRRWNPLGEGGLSPAVWLVVAVSGFASLGLEILWFRLLLQFVTATTEAFTAMLATVLAGIAVGGFLASRILKTRANLTFWLAVVQAGTGLATVMSMSFLLWSIEHGWKTMGLWQAVILVIFPSSMLMGIGFPLALGIATTAIHAGAGRSAIGRRVGRMYALNVAGAIAGSLAAGFLLLPWLGAMNALVAMAGLYLGSALMLALSGPAEAGRYRWGADAGRSGPAEAGRYRWGADRRTLIAVAVGLAAFVPIARRMPDPFKVAIDRRYGDLLREFFRDEGAQTAVSVRASLRQHVLYLDGLHQANDQLAMVTLHRAIGHLPMVLHGSPQEVLIVGMGGGATPGAVSQHPDARVHVVELSEGVRRAAPFFAHVNYDLLNRPNVTVRIDDGRNFLALTDRRFDVITADIIQPEHAGAGHVYSREYFSLVRRALKDNGVVLQWIGHRPSVEYKLIMRTFLNVFPDATLWYDGNFMVGTPRPLTIHAGLVDGPRQHPQTREALDAVGLTSFEVLRSWYTAGGDEMRAFVGPGAVLTDDRPLVEYHHWLPAPKDQPTLDLSGLKGDVNRIIAGAAPGGR